MGEIKMKKWILTIGISALLFGILAIPVTASSQYDNNDIADIINDNTESGKTIDWHYCLRGRISDYEIFEYNGTQYVNCTAVRVRGFIWNLFPNFPNFAFRIKWNRGLDFCIPYEGFKIFGPELLGRYFFVASGSISS